MYLIDKIEGVQRRATKQLPEMKGLSYPERLQALNLPSLRYRALRADMIELYKMLHGHYNNNLCNIVQLWSETSSRTGPRGHSLKLYPKPSRSTMRKESFTLRSVKVWNTLSEEVVSSSSLNIFKNRLDKYWAGLEIKYSNYRADTLSIVEHFKHSESSNTVRATATNHRVQPIIYNEESSIEEINSWTGDHL